MPKIIIREEDLTENVVTNVTTNAVYIPGYAVMGPINTPVLCETLSDFNTQFGSSPYLFRNDQAWPSNFDSNSTPTTKFAYKGDAEKSFIMASELLKQGLPVYYERVFSGETNEWSATATINDTEAEPQLALTLTASTPGLVTTSIYYQISKQSVLLTADGDPVDYYILTVGRSANTQLGTPDISPVTTKFTFSSELASAYSSIAYFNDINGKLDNSGLVTLQFAEGAASVAAVSKDTYLTLPSVEATTDEFTVQSMYTYLSTSGTNSTTGEAQGYSRLEDKGEYVLKFITSGAYPVLGYNEDVITTLMLNVAAERGDAITLIDHTPNNSRSVSALSANSVYSYVSDLCSIPAYNSRGESIYTYGGVYTPYGVYTNSVIESAVELPGSFAFLISLAVSVQSNDNWLAIAGVTRGLVPNLISTSQNITNAIADSYTPRDGVSINPITNIRPYGLTIWGNRTLKNNALVGELTATSFMNIRQLACDVKRTIFTSAKRLTFEQNNDVLWINFKSMVSPLLESMLQSGGITNYELRKQATTERATLKAKVILECVEPVEDFDITISLTDSETLINE